MGPHVDEIDFAAADAAARPRRLLEAPVLRQRQRVLRRHRSGHDVEVQPGPRLAPAVRQLLVRGFGTMAAPPRASRARRSCRCGRCGGGGRRLRRLQCGKCGCGMCQRSCRSFWHSTWRRLCRLHLLLVLVLPRPHPHHPWEASRATRRRLRRRRRPRRARTTEQHTDHVGVGARPGGGGAPGGGAAVPAHPSPSR